ncbi:MAG: hypothetical protein ACPL4H_08205, partial [Anaerolineales bacterium]
FFFALQRGRYCATPSDRGVPLTLQNATVSVHSGMTADFHFQHSQGSKIGYTAVSAQKYVSLKLY